jgi:dUTP pyrophosphatase
MQVTIKTHDSQPLAYATPGACAFDFRAKETVTFAPHEFRLIETGTVIAVPEGFVLQTQPRSSTFKNYGLIQTNSVGIIDQDYCGDNDTIKFPFLNMRNEPVTVEAGTRIGQGMFVKIEKVEFSVVETMNKADRG